MTTNKRSTVCFPVVHKKSSKLFEVFGQVSGIPSNNLIKTIPSELERKNKKLIELSRKSENNPDMSVISTICTTTSDDFHGESYQLALVLADKFARYSTTFQASKIYATGCFIGPKVNSVDHVYEKIELIYNDFRESKKENIERNQVGIFFYPSDSNANNQFDSKLKLLNELGVESHSLELLADINNFILISAKNDSKAEISNKSKRSVFMVVAILLLVGIATLGTYWHLNKTNPEKVEANAAVVSEITNENSESNNKESTANLGNKPDQSTQKEQLDEAVDKNSILESDPNFPVIF